MSIEVRPNRPTPAHRAGQFVPIGVEIDGVRHQRTYSLTSAATPATNRVPTRDDRDEGRIEFAVQRVPHGIVSTHLTAQARVGDLVHLGAPSGEFVLPARDAGENGRSHPADLLLISGGSGITPMIAMLRTLEAELADGLPAPKVTLLHHAPDTASVMFSTELDRLSAAHPWFTVDVATTGAGSFGPDGRPISDAPTNGRLTDARLTALCPDWTDRAAFVCGPAPLIAGATELWADAGALDRLQVERFTQLTGVAPGPSIGSTTAVERRVTFARQRIDTVTSGTESLLETAERCGVLIASGCRTGTCHTCTTRIVDGVVRDRRDGRTATPGAHVQLCVAVAETAVTLDA